MIEAKPRPVSAPLGALADLRRWVLPWALAMLSTACPPAPEAPPATNGAKDVGVSRAPTDKQLKALANPLHLAHLEASEPIECRACHAIQGRGRPTDKVKHRCLGCHEDRRSAVHAKVADDNARECLSCHEFFEDQGDAWACQDCHTAQPGGMRPAAAGKSRRSVLTSAMAHAPTASVHVKDCDACHAPHGKTGLEPKKCLECHEDQAAQHASADPRGRTSLAEPDQCLECHASGHEPATAASGRCGSCHAKDVPKTARFEGHDRCVSCHRPHAVRSPKKACDSCHNKQLTVGAARHADHRDCKSCHAPHAARKPGRCESCHDQQKGPQVAHPGHDVKGACVGCHQPHPLNGVLEIAAQCTTCHEKAKTEAAFHAGGTTCTTCHQPHGFDLKKAGAALCASCHVAPPKAARRPKPTPKMSEKRVKPVEGHDKCQECHVDANHQPAKRFKADCARCHEKQGAAVSKSHSRCVSCHLPHEGQVDTRCADCHEMQASMGRHAPKLTDCDQCHAPHETPARKPLACVKCHQDPLPLLHTHPKHQVCKDCHGFHDQEPRGERASCLTAGCHADLEDHEPQATKCTGCHPFEQAFERRPVPPKEDPK